MTMDKELYYFYASAYDNGTTTCVLKAFILDIIIVA